MVRTLLRTTKNSADLEDDQTWLERSEHWRTQSSGQGRGRPRKFHYRRPLVLCGHGVRLRVDHGTLVIRNGFTHYPQPAEEIRFFKGDSNLPDRIIILDASGAISFDALSWIFEQRITLVQLNWRGDIETMGGASYSANPRLVEAQHAAQSGRKNGKFARWLITEKTTASMSTLTDAFPDQPKTHDALIRLENWLAELRNSKRPLSLPRLQGIEGAVAAAYFQAWQGVPLKWTGTKRKPIPLSWHELGPRKMSWRRSGQNARHPINAMLNYGYGILIGQIRAQVAANGLDPSIGIMHGTSQNRVPLVYDLMEPLRPVVDRSVLKFALAHAFTPGDFTINQFGGCRLNPQMARSAVKEMPPFKEASELVRQFITRLRGSGRHA